MVFDGCLAILKRSKFENRITNASNASFNGQMSHHVAPSWASKCSPSAKNDGQMCCRVTQGIDRCSVSATIHGPWRIPGWFGKSCRKHAQQHGKGRHCRYITLFEESSGYAWTLTWLEQVAFASYKQGMMCLATGGSWKLWFSSTLLGGTVVRPAERAAKHSQNIPSTTYRSSLKMSSRWAAKMFIAVVTSNFWFPLPRPPSATAKSWVQRCYVRAKWTRTWSRS